jgi:hypothetical protein
VNGNRLRIFLRSPCPEGERIREIRENDFSKPSV